MLITMKLSILLQVVSSVIEWISVTWIMEGVVTSTTSEKTAVVRVKVTKHQSKVSIDTGSVRSCHSHAPDCLQPQTSRPSYRSLRLSGLNLAV